MKKQMLWMAAALACADAAQAKEPVDYVNTKIGNISHMLVPVFPAVQLPNGMLRVTPPNESFTTDRINGFCLSVPSHRQGQVFQMMPFSGEAAALRPGWSSRYDQAEALPYRYSVFLDDHDARVELAPGRKAAIYSVTFESDSRASFCSGRSRKVRSRSTARPSAARTTITASRSTSTLSSTRRRRASARSRARRPTSRAAPRATPTGRWSPSSTRP